MRPLSVFVLALVLASVARADGRFYAVVEIRPDLPYQRAFLAHQDGVETLVLQFDSEKPIYPLALTATAGKETEVLLYVMARERVSAGGRMAVLGNAEL